MLVYRFLCSFLLIISSTSLWASVTIEVEPFFISPPATLITKKGSNNQPVFVSNSSFLYISNHRRYQKDPQLYFYDLKSGKEKRVTWQRGTIATPLWSEKDKLLIYSSSTDEDTETPFLLKKYIERFPSSVKNDAFFHVNFVPQEIYSSSLDGRDIERLTKFSGYDGFPAYLPKSERLYFSRWQNNQMSLYAKSVSKEQSPWKVTKTLGHDLGLKLSPDQDQFVWFRFSPDFQSSQLLLSGLNFKDPQFLTLETGINWSPTWHPSGQSVIYSARTNNGRDFDLFEVSLNGGCQRQLTSYDGDEFFPTVSPDGKTLLFTSTQSGKEQIYKLDYPAPFSCSQ